MIRGNPRSSSTRALAGALLLASVAACAEPPPEPGPGVSRELADRRARTLSEVDYTFDLRIPADPGAPIHGEAVIELTWTDPDGEPLVLDFDRPERRVRGLRVNGHAARWAASDDHLVVDPSTLRPHARNRIEVDFETGDGVGLHRDTSLVYTLFVPDRGHGTLPLIDQPELKGTVAWRIEAPDGWEVVANGPRVGANVVRGGTAAAQNGTAAAQNGTAAPAAGDVVGTAGAVEPASARAEGARGTLWTFERSRPIPTYVMAFAAGRFEVEVAERGARSIRVLHRGGGAGDGAIDEVVDAHVRSLDWMEAYTGTPYPFAKLDVVAIPGLRFAGMEHPGVVFYRSDVLLPSVRPSGEAAATRDLPRSIRRARAEIVAHEMAHMWFGNLVTMAWFDDAWMKEVLADFMARRIVEPEFPDPDGDLRFLLTHHAEAYDAEAAADAVPIRRPLANLRDAEASDAAVVHRKAPIVLAHLEQTLGAEAFRTAIRTFLGVHAWRSVTWNDLVAHLERVHGSDLGAWSRAWVEAAGRPVVRLAWEPGAEGRGAVILVQEGSSDKARLWPQRLTVHGEWGERSEWTTVRFDGVEERVVVWEDVPRPERVIPNASGLEYGLFHLDDGWTRALMDGLHDIRPSLLRGTATLLLRDALAEGRVAPEELLGAALSALDVERNDLVASELVDLVGVTYHHHLPESGRAALSSAVSSGLLARISTTRSRTLRSGLVEAWRRGVLAEIGPADVAARLVAPRPNARLVAPTEVSRERLTDLAVRLATHRPILR